MSKYSDLAPYIRSFFEDHLVARRNVSGHTIRSYRDGLKLLLLFAAARLKKPAARLQVTQITEALVIDFLADLERTRSNSIQTRNHRLAAVRNLFEYIGSREPRLLDHCRRVLTIPRKRGAVLPEILYLNKDQISALLGAVRRETLLGSRDYAMLLFMYNTGARAQEVADARVCWLTLRPPYKVELLGKGRKWRTCPLWENTVCHLRGWLDRREPAAMDDDYLFINRFGAQLSRSGIANIIGRYAKKVAASTSSLPQRGISPHTIRHTTAMHMLQAGVETNVIRSWLGHVSIATTDRYVEIDLAMKEKALRNCELVEQNDSLPSWNREPDILAWLESL